MSAASDLRRQGERLSWDDWGLELARAVSLRADCSRRQVGAVLMRPDHTIVATGYNGAAKGERGCLSGGCPRSSSDVEPGSSYDSGPGRCIAIHAEQNALLRASWDEMAESTLYVTHEPCSGCSRTIAGSPVVRVVWPEETPMPEEIIEHGHYCEGCGWYEYEPEFTGDQCNSCGCPQDAHSQVKVVKE